MQTGIDPSRNQLQHELILYLMIRICHTNTMMKAL